MSEELQDARHLMRDVKVQLQAANMVTIDAISAIDAASGEMNAWRDRAEKAEAALAELRAEIVGLSHPVPAAVDAYYTRLYAILQKHGYGLFTVE